MFIVNHKNLFFGVAITLVLLSVVAIFAFGLRFGIEFTGGSILEITFPDVRPADATVKDELAKLDWPGTLVQATGDTGYLIRTKSLTEPERQQLIVAVSQNGSVNMNIERFDSIGPTIGAELRQKAWLAILLVITAIVLYIAFAFRHVSQPVSSWGYGFSTIVALIHDVIIPTGVYVTIGHFFLDAQIDILFVIAILTVLGFSVHDSIVVFDRTRENLKLRTWKRFDETVGHSIEQTMARSINTSLTTLLVVVALYLFGPQSTKFFALTLGVGIIAGAYSSIFIGSPLLVAIDEWQTRREEGAKGRRK